MRIKGTVRWFNDAKGFGFIRGSEGTDVFVHRSHIRKPAAGSGRRTLVEGQSVEFETGTDAKGRHAVDVVALTPIAEPTPA